jgi:hypothetical protein
LCYEVSVVVMRIVLSLMLAMALPIGAMPLSARTCILSNAPSEKACKPGSCANKMCCATSRKNTAPASQPIAKGDSSQQLPVASLVTALSFSGRQIEVQEFRRDTPALSAKRSPQLALLCTFLI